MILENARCARFEPGTNREGDPGPPLWLFLLPSLEERSLAVAGLIDDATARGLARWSSPRLLAGDEGPPERCAVVTIGGDLDAQRIRSLVARLPRAACVYASPAAADEVAAALGGAGWRWLLSSGTPRREAEPPARAALVTPSLGAKPKHWRAKLRRALHRAALRAGVPVSAFAEPHGGDPSGAWLETGGAPFAQDRRAKRRAGVAFFPAGCDPLDPPRWILACAADHGVQLTGRRWELLPARGYRSQKLLFGFGAAPHDAREIVVKVTQEAAFNERLLNEHRVLSHVATTRALQPGTFPEPLFAAQHGGLAVVAETRVPGTPFRQHAGRGSGDALVDRALASIAHLGNRTARRVPGADLSAALRELATRFLALYEPREPVRAALERCLRTLAAEPAVPVVLFHGDPGDWNLLVTPAGDVAFLDWENAEAEGPPLWDAFSFLHSRTVHAAELRGTRPTPAHCVRALLQPSSEADAWVRAIVAQRRALELPGRVVAPLLVLHAMYTALREAWRLAPEELGRGRCLEMLQRLIAEAETSAVLRRAAAD